MAPLFPRSQQIKRSQRWNFDYQFLCRPCKILSWWDFFIVPAEKAQDVRREEVDGTTNNNLVPTQWNGTSKKGGNAPRAADQKRKRGVCRFLNPPQASLK
jgi:hypothetical protein